MSLEFRRRLARRLAWQRAAHDPARDPRNTLPQLSLLRQWQSRRLAASFGDFLADPRMRPAAEFFLSDLYGDKDFSARDSDSERILPMKPRLIPDTLMRAATEANDMPVLSHALDLRMAEQLAQRKQPMAPVTVADYSRAYRQGGYRRLRRHQIELVLRVGYALDAAVKKHGVHKLLRASRIPAQLAGLSELQAFLERGFSAFEALGGAEEFLEAVAARERGVSDRLFAGDPKPFPPP
jgi:hypothetical protein